MVHYRNSAMSRMLPLVMAAREGRQEEVTALLASGLEVNQQALSDITLDLYSQNDWKNFLSRS